MGGEGALSTNRAATQRHGAFSPDSGLWALSPTRRYDLSPLVEKFFQKVHRGGHADLRSVQYSPSRTHAKSQSPWFVNCKRPSTVPPDPSANLCPRGCTTGMSHPIRRGTDRVRFRRASLVRPALLRPDLPPYLFDGRIRLCTPFPLMPTPSCSPVSRLDSPCAHCSPAEPAFAASTSGKRRWSVAAACSAQADRSAAGCSAPAAAPTGPAKAAAGPPP